MAKKNKFTKAIDIGDIVREVCQEYGEEVQNETAKIIRNIAPEMVAQLRSKKFESQRLGYSDSWTHDIVTDAFGTVKVRVYNKDHWQLTHLLEYGHEGYAHGKHFGRVEGKEHIKPVQDWAIKQIMKELESKL
jgi:hypothetical protein